MMWPQSAARRAAQFAAAVEARPISGSLDDDTTALVALAQRLGTVEHPVMRPEYSAGLRVRLLDAAPTLLLAGETVDLPRPSPSRFATGTRRARWSVAGIVTIVLGTCVGVGVASNTALPGEPLYPIKRMIERVEVATAGPHADRGHELLSQATTRLGEVEGLQDEHSQDPAVSILMGNTLGDFTSQANDGARELMAAYQDDGDSQAIAELRDWTSTTATTLEGLSTTLPPSVLDDVANAATVLTTWDARALAACFACSDLAPLHLPPNLATLVSDVKNGVTPTLPGSTVGPLGPGPSTGPDVSTSGPTNPDLTTLPGGVPPLTTAPSLTGGPTTGLPTTSVPTTSVPTTRPHTTHPTVPTTHPTIPTTPPTLPTTVPTTVPTPPTTLPTPPTTLPTPPTTLPTTIITTLPTTIITTLPTTIITSLPTTIITSVPSVSITVPSITVSTPATLRGLAQEKTPLR